MTDAAEILSPSPTGVPARLRIAGVGARAYAFTVDFNGDGLDDLGLTVGASNMSNYVVLYGSTTGSAVTIPWLASGGSFAGGHQIQAWGAGGSYGHLLWRIRAIRGCFRVAY